LRFCLHWCELSRTLSTLRGPRLLPIALLDRFGFGRWWWNDDDAILNFPSDSGGVRGGVLDEMSRVGVDPVGGDNFDIRDDAVRDVRGDYCDSSFTHGLLECLDVNVT